MSSHQVTQNRNQARLGHRLCGSGPRRAIVLNDWLCDTSTWDAAAPYLDVGGFTYAFADLRGYGQSRALIGEYSLREAAQDVGELADSMEWETFHLVGHSMSSLVVLHLAQQFPERVQRVVALTPPPPGGFGASDEMIAASEQLAWGDDAARIAALAQRFGDHWSIGWARYKAARWRATAEAPAIAAYVRLFARDGLVDLQTKIQVPVLAITGERDLPPMRAAAVDRYWRPLCANLAVHGLTDSGHYPMQELPPLTVTLVERFLAGSLGLDFLGVPA
ncbi:MAG TPA: alpha/beta hydrolase [Polyangiaceae bacterium]|nr:alpha/beta hydrolase [Polyangiaceae bacterium]